MIRSLEHFEFYKGPNSTAFGHFGVSLSKSAEEI